MDDIAGKGCDILVPFSERKPLPDIEHSITKTYKKNIWSKFVKAVRDFEMIEEGDRIAVAVSGGKDSMLMAKLFQELKKHWKLKFGLEFIAMDPGYHESIRKLLEDNCRYLDIPVHIYESDIFDVVNKIAKDYPCYMCAKMRRGFLYTRAQELGCNKLALGHHFNDVIETTLLNLLYSGNFKTMLPKLRSTNFENMELIRPLYFIEEAHIRNFIQSSGIWPLNCACMVAAKKTGGKRYEIKELIENMKKSFKGVDKSIFHAACNVNMDSIPGWTKDGEKHSFLEEY
ncbi:MAG: tRNA 2-thiocytidine biosynthesis protein TtcA [Clostridium sp.]|jgi:tRNA(Ile)-lysidine synthase TilS/MesJ|uniref:tRNA 2-thiocytidine biosynthesis TtcA family protein n=1 Tax=Clostridium sp. TaxID=1506 RepID=UPI0025BCBEB7|nr:ATP-binding protein [Clostridium sp.]MCH3965063.1 tRNA 2-thiocytidine biosynthesis protein TtcA [Clostridium sp.]MCI1714284.1 tRNA 2-thiocytidine biosynthesis protein TtcA [Clostridium sp.]MCI1798546.1 tRNA 2-thiocytidine biosynthesis protein TtcA [Clostridium sp.]MCI1812723.1 tRNA 2-thiocytidine biosynthesis protein TtcA [Clostridium sp.]MCI1869355.1 tRNA 2-thiocytidine biosynthesis protein TtcA [Clostridium sp.]